MTADALSSLPYPDSIVCRERNGVSLPPAAMLEGIQGRVYSPTEPVQSDSTPHPLLSLRD